MINITPGKEETPGFYSCFVLSNAAKSVSLISIQASSLNIKLKYEKTGREMEELESQRTPSKRETGSQQNDKSTVTWSVHPPGYFLE